MNHYTMKDRLEIGDVGIQFITPWLERKPETVAVTNVENDKRYRKLDIDLIWMYLMNNETKIVTIEVKTDSYSTTGNYFFETVSNQGKDTPGCFLYSEADFWFYFFKDTRELNIIPLQRARQWFLENDKKYDFREIELKTDVGVDGYKTKGKLVSKKLLSEQVLGIKTIILPDYFQIAG
ncbi:hypothetical protein CVD28_01800 [Bacillus sp. M6-12]|uniref:hypothetical protein n=1 Tax=Bacillus sp. M6-12 TaxID=2054166 RepID=UPI000C785CD1|nr:hypothetical protein [Bacillus sp. M6-12]PLS19166.1 hypothetical protein CVD28_01800 [Bacillus sp. M6-12]